MCECQDDLQNPWAGAGFGALPRSPDCEACALKKRSLSRRALRFCVQTHVITGPRTFAVPRPGTWCSSTHTSIFAVVGSPSPIGLGGTTLSPTELLGRFTEHQGCARLVESCRRVGVAKVAAPAKGQGQCRPKPTRTMKDL